MPSCSNSWLRNAFHRLHSRVGVDDNGLIADPPSPSSASSLLHARPHACHPILHSPGLAVLDRLLSNPTPFKAIASSAMVHVTALTVGFCSLVIVTAEPESWAGADDSIELQASFKLQLPAAPEASFEPRVVVTPYDAMVDGRYYKHRSTTADLAYHAQRAVPVSTDAPIPTPAVSQPPRATQPPEPQAEVARETPSPRRQTRPATMPAAAAQPLSQQGAKREVRFVHQPIPQFPAELAGRGIAGRVFLQVWIAADGRVERVEVLESSGYGLLDANAVRAVRRWRAAPGSTPESVTFGVKFRQRR